MESRKDQSIVQLIIHLEERYGSTCFIIEDNWEADLCAIGITDLDNRCLLYFSSYEKPDNTFYVEVEEKYSGKNPEEVKCFTSLTMQEIDQVFKHYIVNQTSI